MVIFFFFFTSGTSFIGDGLWTGPDSNGIEPNTDGGKIYPGANDPGVGYDLDLSMKWEYYTNFFSIWDFELKAGFVKVTNGGSARDTIVLKVVKDFNPNEEGWDAWLVLDKVELNPGDTIQDELFVQGPHFNFLGAMKVTIIATSTGNPDINDKLFFWVNTCPCTDMHMVIENNTKHVRPGEGADYLVNLYLSGEDVNVKFSLEGPKGWKFSLNRTEVYFMGPGKSSVLLSVTPSITAKAGEKGKVNITVENEFPTGVKTIQAITIIDPLEQVDTQVEGPIRHIGSDQSANYSILVRNLGDVQEPLDLKVDLTPGWSITHSQEDLDLEAFSEKILNVSVAPPKNATRWDRCEVTISINNSKGTIMLIRRLWIIIDHINEETIPGESAVVGDNATLAQETKPTNAAPTEQKGIASATVPVPEDREPAQAKDLPLVRVKEDAGEKYSEVAWLLAAIGMISFTIIIFLVHYNKRRR